MTTDHLTLAERLRRAYTEGPVEPLRDGLDPSDADGAYAVQSLNTQFWSARRRRIVGRKIGLTAEAVQRQLGVSQPDFGVLFDDMAVPDGGRLGVEHLLQGKVEAEIALILSADLDDVDATRSSVAAATAAVAPALEIVDSRIRDWRITFADTVADNASAAFFVLGGTRGLDGLDLATSTMRMTFDGETVSTGIGSACLGHPLEAAAWLARTLAQRGDPLRAGDIVLTGALGPMVELLPGISVAAEIEGVGSVSFAFGTSE